MASSKRPGRPLKIESPEKLREDIAAYFAYCAEHKRPLTVSGLAVALDTSRSTLIDYENGQQEGVPEDLAADYSNTIKSAKERIERWAEEYLYEGKNVAGAIFSMKNNWDWKDRTETDVTTNGKDVGFGAYTDEQLRQMAEGK